MMQSLYTVAAAVANSDLGKQIPGMDVGTQQTGLGVGKSFSLGGLTAVVGMVVVFIGLVLLIVIISLMARILRQKRAPQKKEEPPVPAAPVAPMEPAAPVVTYAPPQVEDDAEIVAAIAAALECMEQAQGRRPGGFVVRSIRRVGAAAPAWGHAGRRDAMGQG